MKLIKDDGFWYFDERPIRKLPDHDTIDWTMQDIEISRLYDCSRELVRHVRKAKNKPRSPFHRRRPMPACSRCVSKMLAMEPQALSAGTIAAQINESEATVSASKRLLGWPKGKVKSFLPDINWNLENRDLCRIWRHTKTYFSQTRCRHGLTRRRGQVVRRSGLQLEQYIAECRAEEAKAEAWRKQRVSEGYCQNVFSLPKKPVEEEKV